MPSLTTTIEENSPLITFLNGWSTGLSSSDGLASRYSESSFMATQTPGASASFVFNGTGVKVFGAKRENHGQYLVKVDDIAYPPMDGKAGGEGLFQQNLFSVDNLKMGRHEVTITNQGTTFLDVDFVTWTTEVGRPSDKLFVNTVQDNDPSFAYSSASAWNLAPKNIGSFLDGSGQVMMMMTMTMMLIQLLIARLAMPVLLLCILSKVCVAFLELRGNKPFPPGEGVSLYGPVGPDGAPYTVQLDREFPRNFTSNKDLYKPQVMLYNANNLGPGQHRLQVTCQPTSSGQVLAIDYANVYSTTPPRATASPSGLSPGAIAGITLSIVCTIGVLVALFLYLRRRQRRQFYHDELNSTAYTPDKTPAPTGDHQGHVTISSFGPGPTTSEGRFMTTPFRLNMPSASNNISATPKRPVRFSDFSEERSPSDPSTSTQSNPNEHTLSSSSSSPTSPRRDPGPSMAAIMPRKKGQLPELPSTAGLTLIGTVPEEELRENRRMVNGRAQDFGSSTSENISSVSPILELYDEAERTRVLERAADRVANRERDNDDGMLPPDYTQATEPYHK